MKQPENRRSTGRSGEDEAAQFLKNLGYVIVKRRYHAGLGEIDLIAIDGDEVVFVEVKLRRTAGVAFEAVSPQKRKAQLAAANKYLREVDDPNRDFRFDFIQIESGRIDHQKGVFRDEWNEGLT